MTRRKAEQLTKQDFDDVFKELLEEKREQGWGVIIIVSTFDIARKLWDKFHVQYKKEANIVREKMREWWNSYKWKYTPKPHKIVCGVAVNLASPMGYCYCALEKLGMSVQSLIIVYQDQNEFKKAK